MDEFALAHEAVEIITDISFRNPARNFRHRTVVVEDIAFESPRILFPEFVITLEHIIGERPKWLPIDFHDDAVWHKMRIHPYERHAFLYEEFVVRIFVEDDLCDDR